MKKQPTIMCLQCGEKLVSVHRHDFVMCHCKNKTFVDGGDDYHRYGGVDMGKVEVLARRETMKKKRTIKRKAGRKAAVSLVTGETVTVSNKLLPSQIGLVSGELPKEAFWMRFLRLLGGE